MDELSTRKARQNLIISEGPKPATQDRAGRPDKLVSPGLRTPKYPAPNPDMDPRLSKGITYTAAVASHPADGIYCSQPLGAVYSEASTTFRVWAPTASKLILNRYESPLGGKAAHVPMARNEDGSWEVTIEGNLLGCCYTYSAAGSDPRFNADRELLDPYARAVTGPFGRSIVTNDTQRVAPRPDFPMCDAVIYEMHLRDFTIDPDSGVQRRGKYLGLTEAGRTLTGRLDIATGLDHLTDLGINVVQLMPVSEFHGNAAEDLYGWGYDVVHHFSPAGWYSTERNDASRVSELKRVVSALHDRGIRVTLDVVLNHTFELINKGLVFSFEGLVPGYYYRLKPDGSYWDGSGCGNEFRSESPMGRRYILDCLSYWVTEYGIDGFRIDLLGLMDFGTMQAIVDQLRAIDPHLLIYGEPWGGGTSPIELTSKGKQWGRGWAVFNDDFRDALKGNVFDANARGFLQGGDGLRGVKTGLKGSIDSFAASPLETINYLECHDNHTLWDRLTSSSFGDYGVDEADRRAMHKLAAVLLMTAQGIPFIHSGQELLRTKGGLGNSYDKPDHVNMIRWKQKAENFDVFSYYQSLIELRRRHRLFRYRTAHAVTAAVKFLDDDLGFPVPSRCLGYQVEDVRGSDEWKRALILINTSEKEAEFQIGKGFWRIFGDGQKVSVNPLKTSLATLRESSAIVPPRNAVILGEYRADLNDDGHEYPKIEGEE